jgi:protein ImuB
MLAPLPVAALRLSPATARTLRQLGLKKIGSLTGNLRSPLASRFEKELFLRLDQALGKAAEALNFITPPPTYHCTRHLMEPVFSAEAVVAHAKRLAESLIPELDRDGAGVRAFTLTLYRANGEATAVDIGLALPTRSAKHLARLLALKLERIEAIADAGFGFESLSLFVTTAERMTPRQEDLAPAMVAANEERLATLVDRLRQRLGEQSVRWLEPLESHLPEKSERSSGEPHAWPAQQKLLPLLLLSRVEETEVVSSVPEGPPKRFRWRGRAHNVTHAEGPERIGSEWWKAPEPTRDYYIVEDDKGRRYWLYREGIYERETAIPRWFVHGFFA